MKQNRMNKKALEMSFSWMFAIIVGAIILLFAVYLASKLIETNQYGINTETARDFANLFEPLQTSIGETSITSRTLITDTRIYTSCNLDGIFGSNKIELSERSGFNNEFTLPGGDITVKNHYIFAEDVVEGKDFYFFTKPFEMPFKAADLMIIYSGSYCFVNAPDEIEEFVSALENNTNLFVSDIVKKCGMRENMKTVCFSGGSCDININCYEDSCEGGSIRKNSKEIIFTKGLLYGAIFGSFENYNCNVKRIMSRLSELSIIYREKAVFVSGRGCTTGLEEDMNNLAMLARSYKKSQDLIAIEEKAKEIEEKNRNLECQLF